MHDQVRLLSGRCGETDLRDTIIRNSFHHKGTYNAGGVSGRTGLATQMASQQVGGDEYPHEDEYESSASVERDHAKAFRATTAVGSAAPGGSPGSPQMKLPSQILTEDLQAQNPLITINRKLEAMQDEMTQMKNRISKEGPVQDISQLATGRRWRRLGGAGMIFPCR